MFINDVSLKYLYFGSSFSLSKAVIINWFSSTLKKKEEHKAKRKEQEAGL